MKLCRAYVRQYTVHRVLDLAYNFNIYKRRHPTDTEVHYRTSYRLIVGISSQVMSPSTRRFSKRKFKYKSRPSYR